MEPEKTTPELEKKQSKFEDLSIPLSIVFAGVLIAGAIIFSDPKSDGGARAGIVNNQDQEETTGVPADVLAITQEDHVLGNPGADVVIIEYSDTECPYCKRFHTTMLQVMENYGKSGSVAWVYRHWPLDQLHPKARKEAEALECAGELGGNDAFWKYTDRIFEITPGNNGLDESQLPLVAEFVGLDVGAFNACLSSGKYAARIEKDFESGVLAGVRGTPFSVVYNRKTGKQLPINGALTYEQVKAIVGAVAAGGAGTK